MNNQNHPDNDRQSGHTQPEAPPDSTSAVPSATDLTADTPELEARLRTLEQERDWLYLLLNHSRDSIYFKDCNSKFLRVSKGHSSMQIYGSPEEVVGKSDFDIFPEEHAREAYDDEMSIIATGEPVLGIVERITAPQTPEKWVFTSKMPIRDKNGTITGTFGISRDITQIKQYEKELHKSKDGLEERVRERTRKLQTTNEILERRIRQLDILSSESYEMAQHTGIYELGVTILDAFTSRLDISTAAVFQFSGHRYKRISASGTLKNAAFSDAVEEAIPQLQLSEIRTPKVVRNWKTTLPESVPWTNMSESSGCIAVPLLADNRSVGMLLLFSDTGAGQLLKEERSVILTLAAHAAVCMSNALYYLELNEKAHLEGQLQAARSIQQRLTPDRKPDIPRINLKGLYVPAYEVGGDYLDYFKNDAGCWVVVVADVSGKGVPAALLMTILRSAFRVEGRSQTSAKQLLCAVNDSIQVNLDDRTFITAICLIISPDGSSMSYSRAGHPRLIRITAGEHRIETLKSDGIALGVIAERESFERMATEESVPLRKGERYIIYTDGLTEAFNVKKNMYDIGRLHSVLETKPCATTPEATLDAIMKDFRSFTAGARRHDDLTIIAMEVI